MKAVALACKMKDGLTIKAEHKENREEYQSFILVCCELV